MSDGILGWYGVRCVFEWASDDADRRSYEERVTLWRADGFDEAIAKAEAEAAEYLSDDAGYGPQGYLGLAQAYLVAGGLDGDDERSAHLDGRLEGLEVFSMIRWSALEPEDYLTAFFDTGEENNGDAD